MTFICDIKFDINMCGPHYVYFFREPPPQFSCLTFDIFLIIIARIRRMTGGYIFTLCVSPHLGGGIPTIRVGGGYLLSQVWMEGGVPTFPGLDRGGVPTFRVGGGVPTFPCLDGGVPTFWAGGGGTYLPRSGWGDLPVGTPSHPTRVGTPSPHQGRYPPTREGTPPPPTGRA